ncbi:MAG: YbaB/EbfC family nucleoid-associated protein [Phycisphaeraceae bacterium]
MFDQMKNLKQLAGMLGNPEQLRERMEQMQAEMARLTVEAEAGAGAVRVTVNGRFQLERIEFDQPMLTALVGEGEQADREMVEELILAAVNAGMEKAQAMVREEVGKMTGGMNLPGMEGLMGGQG